VTKTQSNDRCEGRRGYGGRSECESRENRLGELNAELRSFPPNHAATADGCVVKHKIECIGNSNGTFHFEAGAAVRQVADHTTATFEDDLRSLENAGAHFILAVVIHCSIFWPHAALNGALAEAIISVACVVRF
jgi:hypothetical protein